jgi:hypothetical protein
MSSNSKLSFWNANGLSLVLVGIFLATLAGQCLAGLQTWNDERTKAGAAPLGLIECVGSGHFVAATFENWESEFLQMGMYVLLTVRLRQRGSAESRPMDPTQENPRIDAGPAPWPVRRGGWWKSLYSVSLSLALFLLFLVSFLMHALGSWTRTNAEHVMDGELPQSLSRYLLSARFWFESLQNWQSEFLAVLSLVLLSIVLRQKDSPQSKPLEAPHAQTGD